MNHVINWLLEDNTPLIKYRTMIELQGLSKEDIGVKRAYNNLLDSEELSHVLDKFHAKNKWEHINALLAIAEFGLTRNDLLLDDYVECIITEINASMKCAKILLLRNLVSLGYYDHPWVKEQIHTSFSTIREDGTVRCLDKGKKTNDSKLPNMGCYRQTTTYLLLAAELKKIGIILPQFDAIANFYMNHNVVYHNVEPEKIIIKDMTSTFFPIDHVHIGIQMIMYGLSILGYGNDNNCQKAWEILHSYKDAEGKYLLSDSFKEPYFDVGAVGQSNKWVTLYVLLAKMYSGVFLFHSTTD